MLNSKKNILIPIITIVLGILLIIWKGDVIKYAAMGVGVLFAISGIVYLINDLKKKSSSEVLTIDAIIIAIGVLLFCFAWWIIVVIRVILGILFIMYGFLKLFTIIEGLTPIQSISIAVISILFMVIGVFIICDKEILYYIAGGLMIFDGLVDIVFYLLVRKNTTAAANAKRDVLEAETTVINENVSE